MAMTINNEPLTAAGARSVLTSADAASRALQVKAHWIFMTWAVAWLVGYLAIWWSTRSQTPYQGPEPWSSVTLMVSLAVALAVTIALVVRAMHGVTGRSRQIGTYYALTWVVGMCGWASVQATLARLDIPAGAIGILSCVVPALLVATIYVLSAGIWMQPAFLVSGICFALSAVIGAGADPATAALVIGVVGAAGCAAGAVIAGLSGRL
jgi:hypothetical protein